MNKDRYDELKSQLYKLNEAINKQNKEMDINDNLYKLYKLKYKIENQIKELFD